MTKLQKVVALSLVLALVVFAAAACGVPEEDDFEMEDDFGYQLEVEESFAGIDFEVAEAPALNVLL